MIIINKTNSIIYYYIIIIYNILKLSNYLPI